MKKVTKIVKRIGAGILIVFILGVASFIIAGLIPAKDPLPGLRHSTYVPMQDGTRIAVRYKLPSNLAEGEKVPVVMEST
ncbi:MAG TPA: hypothetical protein VHY08_08270, partial [Bacillota bacterium]|nr:hypothetical protein [Bacillota bacterium]